MIKLVRHTVSHSLELTLMHKSAVYFLPNLLKSFQKLGKVFCSHWHKPKIQSLHRFSLLILLHCDRRLLPAEERSVFSKLNNVMEALYHWFLVCN